MSTNSDTTQQGDSDAEENWLAPFGAASFFSAIAAFAVFSDMVTVAIVSMVFVLVVTVTRMILAAQKNQNFPLK